MNRENSRLAKIKAEILSELNRLTYHEKANLSEIRKEIEYWTNEVARLENIEKRGGRNRIYRAVPRDL